MSLHLVYSSGQKKVPILLHATRFPFRFISVSISFWRVGVLLKRKMKAGKEGMIIKAVLVVEAPWFEYYYDYCYYP